MAISATFQFASSGGNAVTQAVVKNLWDTYTVLSFNYTLERTYDKTGRPSSVATITTINVKLRGLKQKTTPFHDWINDPDKKMSGDIKIFDSSGIISSATQGITGSSSVLDVDEITDVPIDIMGETMDIGMDDASKYSSNGIYNEMSHADLVSYASAKGVTIETSDTDDDIRRKLAIKDEVEGMTLEELKSYCSSHSITVSSESIEDYKREVYLHKVKNMTRDTKENAKDRGTAAMDTYKQRTTDTAKSTAKNAVKIVLESARCISFEDAYCVSLTESFENNPDSQGELDKSYPWIIEIGIRPKTVKVTGEQVGPVAGSSADFTFF